MRKIKNENLLEEKLSFVKQNEVRVYKSLKSNSDYLMDFLI
ncbi:MAG: hypothetical protein QXU20_04765 [Candidatus Woesearchaeota archaeon]